MQFRRGSHSLCARYQLGTIDCGVLSVWEIGDEPAGARLVEGEMFFDPMYFVFALPGLLLALWAQSRVRGAFNKYSQVGNMTGLTGAQAARQILNANGLHEIALEITQGDLSDHYDPSKKVLRLSPAVAQVASVAALGIAAHEVGHAIQDGVGYGPMRARSAIVPVASIGSQFGPWLFIGGLILNFTGLAWLGLILFAAAVVFSLVTLPVEFDASRRAMVALQTNGMVSTVEYDGAKSVLDAAALTYVAGLLAAVGTLAYYAFLLLGRSSDD